MKILVKVILFTAVSLMFIKPAFISTVSSDWPVIFYVPHADDEAIGLAAAVAEHKSSGRPVYMVLVSSEQNQGLLDIMNGKVRCPLAGHTGWWFHPRFHHFNMTSDELDKAREKEYITAALSLGVNKAFVGKDGKTIPDELFNKNYDEAMNQVKDLISHFETLYPGASHKLVSGARDTYFDVKGWTVNRTHKAIYEAAVKFHEENPQTKDMSFYRVYIYRDPKGNQNIDAADFVFENKPEWQSVKQKSLDAYKTYSPKKGRYALGYHSFPDLINKAYTHPYTYVDFLPETSEQQR